MATRENSNDQKRKRKGALTDLPIKFQATTLDAAQIDDSVEYIRGFCLTSMKKAKYKVYICIEDKQNLCFAYCECPIRLAQSCSHIGGLLFHLHHLH
uniref:SWIM-type domain-containing protein n=1 Tax=Magallana gigas TaxID=29159 RepID=A0A8W8M8G7_MAGGI